VPARRRSERRRRERSPGRAQTRCRMPADERLRSLRHRHLPSAVRRRRPGCRVICGSPDECRSVARRVELGRPGRHPRARSAPERCALRQRAPRSGADEGADGLAGWRVTAPCRSRRSWRRCDSAASEAVRRRKRRVEHGPLGNRHQIRRSPPGGRRTAARQDAEPHCRPPGAGRNGRVHAPLAWMPAALRLMDGALSGTALGVRRLATTRGPLFATEGSPEPRVETAAPPAG